MGNTTAHLSPVHGQKSHRALFKALVLTRPKTEALKLIRSDRKLFNSLLNNEKKLTGKGNRLDRSSNRTYHNDLNGLLAYIERQAHSKGAISDALTRAAHDHATGKPAKTAARDFINDTSEEIKRGVLATVRRRNERPRPEYNSTSLREDAGIAESEPRAQLAQADETLAEAISRYGNGPILDEDGAIKPARDVVEALEEESNFIQALQSCHLKGGGHGA